MSSRSAKTYLAKVSGVAGVVTTVSLLAHLPRRELAAFAGTVIAGTLYRVAHSRAAEHNKAA